MPSFLLPLYVLGGSVDKLVSLRLSLQALLPTQSSDMFAHFLAITYTQVSETGLDVMVSSLFILHVFNTTHQLVAGDIMNLNVLGKHIIVLSSQKAASDLLEKKSAIYSSRPRYAVFEL